MLSLQHNLADSQTQVGNPYCRESHLLSLGETLDHALLLLKTSNNAPVAIQILTDGLRTLRERVSKHYWTSVIIPAARDHPVSALIYQCPLTRHACTRPRGYPGDAELLDLIYFHPAAAPKLRDVTIIGKAVYDVTAAVSACESVRERRRIVARKIDQIATARPGADILSLACGHLREAELSQALKTNQVHSLTALDQDQLSLSSVEAYAAETSGRIRPRRITVRDIISGRHDLPRFDFIYSAGLYDYLQAPMAARLTRKLFDLLNSGGTLLLANFLDGIWEAPYMEAYMDWHLIYRSEQDIQGFLGEIPPQEIASRSYWSDSSDCIGYVEICRQ